MNFPETGKIIAAGKRTTIYIFPSLFLIRDDPNQFSFSSKAL